MSVSERLQFILSVDAKGAVKGFESVGKAADKELGKAEQKLDKIGAGLTKFGAGAVAFAGLAGAGLVKVAMGASDLEESINAVQVTFGDAAEGILKLGENAARSVGLSKEEFNSLSVQFSSFATTVAGKGGDVVATMDELTGRAADFASVMNLDVAEAARVFQSGLAGETEPLKKFGIDLSAAAVGAYAVANGISASAKSMTEAEKVQARYGLLMEQTAKTAGDFANTSDGMANQQRILKAEFKNLSDSIGSGILPMLTEVIGVATKVTGALSKMSPEAQAAAGKFAALGVAGIGMLGTLSLLAGQVIKMRDRFTTLGDDGTRSLNNLGKAAKGLGVAMGVAAVALALYSVNASRAAAEQSRFQDALSSTAGMTDQAAAETFRGITVLADAVGDLDKTIAEFVANSPEAARRLLETGGAALAGAEAENKLRKAVEEADKARTQANKTLDEYGNTVEDATEATDEATDATNRSADAVRQQDKFIQDVNRTYQRQQDELEKSRARTESFRQAAEALGTEWDRLKGKFSDRAAFLDLEDSFDNVQTAAEEAFTAAAEGSEDAERAARDHERAMLDLKGKVVDYGSEVNDLPDQVITNILSLIDQGKLAEAEAALARLERARTINYIPVVQAPRVPGGNRAMASGGRAEGGVTLVGERGPELVDMPQGARVRSAVETITDTRGGSGGMTFQTVIQGNVYGVDHLERIMDERDRRLANQLRQGRRA